MWITGARTENAEKIACRLSCLVVFLVSGFAFCWEDLIQIFPKKATNNWNESLPLKQSIGHLSKRQSGHKEARFMKI